MPESAEFVQVIYDVHIKKSDSHHNFTCQVKYMVFQRLSINDWFRRLDYQNWRRGKYRRE